MFTRLLVLTFCFMASAFTSGPANAHAWTQEEKLAKFSRQTHHWGQKGEARPNNGWAAYSKLRIDFGDKEYIVLQQDSGELIASVYSKQDNTLRSKAVSIPGAGLFYFPKTGFTCAPDPIEEVGLYAELALFYLSQSFKNGPTSINRKVSVSAKGKATEIRFMQGVLKQKKPWKVDVTVTPNATGGMHAEIVSRDTSSPLSVDWFGQPEYPAIADGEAVDNWLLCWSGVQSTHPNGSSTVTYAFPKVGAVRSFGEIRRVLREMASKHALKGNPGDAARPSAP